MSGPGQKRRAAPAIDDGQAAPPRDKPWIFRTYAGHSTARESNRLYRANLAKGQTGLSIAFDLPTQRRPGAASGASASRRKRRGHRPKAAPFSGAMACFQRLARQFSAAPARGEGLAGERVLAQWGGEETK